MEVPEIQQVEQELLRIRKRKKRRGKITAMTSAAVTAASVTVLVSVLLFPMFRVYGSSMNPTLHDGEIVISGKNSRFESGDLIAFTYNNKVLVKRLIANPGDWVEIQEDGTVLVNNVPLEEPYISEKALGECDLEFPYQVPENRYFVLGDHRETAVDSRSADLGCVEKQQIEGKLLYRIWPLSKMGSLNR